MTDQAELEAVGLRLVAEHIQRVQGHMTCMTNELMWRLVLHDQTKYNKEELGLVLGKAAFDKLAYMSEEERAALGTVQDALEHHYTHNTHHPEHYTNGVDGMSLIDLLELVCDWKAAGEMSAEGSFRQSVELNTERFNLSPQLVNIILNTGRDMGWINE